MEWIKWIKRIKWVKWVKWIKWVKWVMRDRIHSSWKLRFRYSEFVQQTFAGEETSSSAQGAALAVVLERQAIGE